MKLNDLKPNEGAKHNRKRKGRGISAGQGKTAGRGTKGEGSRAGTGGHLYRQGGNLPFYRHLPFIRGEGFTPPNQVEFEEINLDKLANFPADTLISPETLLEADLIRNLKKPVVIMGRGEITVPLIVRVQRITKSAKAKIEAAGGRVESL